MCVSEAVPQFSCPRGPRDSAARCSCVLSSGLSWALSPFQFDLDALVTSWVKYFGFILKLGLSLPFLRSLSLLFLSARTALLRSRLVPG